MMIAEFGFGATLLTIAGVCVSLLLIALVLLQKNRGAGLSGAFGGVGGHSAFGTKTGDFLTWFTVALVVVFLLIFIVGTFVFQPEQLASQGQSVSPTGTAAQTETATPDTEEQAPTTPAPTPAPAPATPAAAE